LADGIKAPVEIALSYVEKGKAEGARLGLLVAFGIDREGFYMQSPPSLPM